MKKNRGKAVSMESFAVLHITKYKSLGGIGSHIDRQHVAPNVEVRKIGLNEELLATLGDVIDPSKTHLKEEICAPVRRLERDIADRITKGYRCKGAIRKDAVKALGIILTGSHERMKVIESDAQLFARWKEANYAFACEVFGQDNIVRFTLHRDEKTPHFHCVVVPLTRDGRLSAKAWIGSPAKLRAYQDRYAQSMAQFGLSRGLPKELTQKTHLSTKDYYRSINNIARKAEKLTEGIKSRNLFRLKQVREQMKEHLTFLERSALEERQKHDLAQMTNKNILDKHQRDAYKMRLQEEVRASYEHIKREINLPNFAVSRLNWKVLKEKSTKRDVVLHHDVHGKIIVPTQPKKETGHWVFSWVERQGGGTILDLLLESGWSWRAIRDLSRNEAKSSLSEYAMVKDLNTTRDSGIEDPASQTALADQNFRAVVADSGSNYLTHRGIHQAVYEDLSQVHANRSRACFCLYKNLDREERLCSTINYSLERDGSSKKYFQKGLPRGLSILSEKGAIDRVFITESPIDALSYRQIQLSEQASSTSKTQYISTCGNLSLAIKEELSQVFTKAKKHNQSVLLSLDNDLAGRKMTQELSQMLTDQACSYQIILPPQGKDWNEYLLHHYEVEVGPKKRTRPEWMQEPLSSVKPVASFVQGITQTISSLTNLSKDHELLEESNEMHLNKRLGRRRKL